jgi:peptidyl-prolyl cis-trans isomerase B (cyclophilin B)
VQPRFLPTLCLLLLAPLMAQAQTPRLSEERVILHTVAGDVVIAFYPDVAPEHTKQILKLVRLGCYDHTHFGRIEPTMVLQLGDVSQRPEEYPLTEAQKTAIHPIRAEFSALPHRRGVVSMARADGQPDSATTSFSIILNTASHLDGHYTIFGEVVYGMEAVTKMVLVPPKVFDPRLPPTSLVPLEVKKAEVVDAKDLDTDKLTPAHDVWIPPATIYQAHTDAWAIYRNQSQGQVASASLEFQTTYLLTGGVLLVILLSLASFVGAGRLNLRWLVSLNMLTILVGAFLLLVLLTPYALQDKTQVLAVVVFVSFCGVFKLLSRFESVG